MLFIIKLIKILDYAIFSCKNLLFIQNVRIFAPNVDVKKVW